jgi:hypothetical protein
MSPESPQKASGRGCVIFGAVAALLLLLLIAISLGWVGSVDRGKVSDLPVVGGNRT